MERRDAAIQRIDDIGLVSAGSWSAAEPVGVDTLALRLHVRHLGLASWLEAMVVDLADRDLSPDNMLGFPDAHGGITVISISDIDNRVAGFRGSLLSRAVQVSGPDPATTVYLYTVLSGPAGFVVGAAGVFTYEIPGGAAMGEDLPFEIDVVNQATGKGRRLSGSFYVMVGEVIASEVVGPDGGTVADQWEDIVVDVPPGAAAQPSTVSVVRGRNMEEDPVVEIRSDLPVTEVVVHLPPPEVLDHNTPAAVAQPQATPVAAHLTVAAVAMPQAAPYVSDYDWGGIKAYFIDREVPGTDKCVGDICTDTSITRLPDKKYVIPLALTRQQRLSVRFGSDLRSQIPSSNLVPVGDPVLFIHGYHKGDGFHEARDYWNDFPDRISDLGYMPFEFMWRTNARFQDVAEDLRYAVDEIARKTGKTVHLVAHSFGGVLSRVYLQGLVEPEAIRPVASLVTIGTPHSGIADKDREMHGVDFMRGQDSPLFEFCAQLSCYQMGEPLKLEANDRNLFDVQGEEGFIAAEVADFAGHLFPENLPIEVLIGLLAPSKKDSGYILHPGDGLITYNGQRFSPDYGENDPDSDIPLLKGKYPFRLPNGEKGMLNVTERILGTNLNSPQLKPYWEPLIAASVLSPPNGYWHSYGSTLFHDSKLKNTGNSLYEAALECADGPVCTNDAYRRVKAWLEADGHAADDSFIPTITATVKVVDAKTKDPIEGAEVFFAARGDVILERRYTGPDGMLKRALPFSQNVLYSASVFANGYRSGRVDSKSPTGSTPDETDGVLSFPTVFLQDFVFGRGELKARILRAGSNEELEGVSCTLTATDGAEQTETSDDAGICRFETVIKGSYSLRLGKLGYLGVSYDLPNLLFDTGFEALPDLSMMPVHMVRELAATPGNGWVT
ncbi:MAG: hypothetical protein CO109_05990, partial [Deltaproteobacteria bacterium CG_4_9_14_3_um_filter_65_9]